MLNNQHIGNRIKAAMDARGVGPTEVGKEFGVKAPSVNDWISTGRIHKKHLSKLVSYFGQPLEWWIDGIPAKQSEQPNHRVSEPIYQPPERAITIADITGIWLSLNPERQRRLLANAHDFLTAQRAEKPNDGNPYANVAAPLPPIPGKSPHINKANP